MVRMSGSQRIRLAVALSLGAVPSGASAATYYWREAVTTGDIQTPGSWSTGSPTGGAAATLPGTADGTIFDLSGTGTFSLTASAGLTNTSYRQNKGTIDISLGSYTWKYQTGEPYQQIARNSGDGSQSILALSSGTLQFGSDLAEAPNGGSATAGFDLGYSSGTSLGHVIIRNGATFNWYAMTAAAAVTPFYVHESGKLTVETGGTFNSTGSLRVRADNTAISTPIGYATATINGTLNVVTNRSATRYVDVGTTGATGNGGRLIVGGSVNVASLATDSTIYENGELILTGGAVNLAGTSKLQIRGLLAGNGSIVAPVNASTANSRIVVGNGLTSTGTTGLLDITGALTTSTTTSVELDFGTVGGIVSADQIESSGTATIGKAITFSSLGQFSPSSGGYIDFVVAPTISYSFVSTDTAALTTLLAGAGYTDAFTYGIVSRGDGNQALRLAYVAVPEPGVVMLLAASSMLLGLRRRQA